MAKKAVPHHSSGMFEYKTIIGKNSDGTAIRKSFYSNISKPDAKKKAEAYKLNKTIAEHTGTAFVSQCTGFKDWANKWLEIYKKPNTSENTYLLTYKNTVDTHLVPYFGNTDLIAIKPADIQSFFMTKKELSMSMQDKMKLCLMGIFETAIDNDLCYKNPAKSATYTSDQTKAVKNIYSDLEIKIVTGYAKSRVPEVAFILETGLRRGEVLGLMWSDVDFVNNCFNVNRSIADKKGGGTQVRPPKWNSYRELPLSPVAKTILETQKNNDSEYVFPSETRCVQSPNCFSQKVKRFMALMILEYPKLEELTPHELRHTYGTMLRRKGVDIYTIQKLLGHKDIKITTEIYVHNEIEVLRNNVKASY